MAVTKRSKSRGNDAAEAELEYLRKAAKLTPYEVDIYERLIYVPENELAEAEDDLTVCHLRNGYKFMIQSCIPEATEKKELFEPVMYNHVLVRKEAVLSPYKRGDLYRVVSTSAIMRIVRTEQKKVELEYISYDTQAGVKHNLIISEEQLATNLRRGVLETYNQ